MHREHDVQSGAALHPPVHPWLGSGACRRVGRAHPLLSLYWPPLPEAALGDARRARTRGRAVCPGPPSRPAAACAASLRSTRLQKAQPRAKTGTADAGVRAGRACIRPRFSPFPRRP